MSRVVALLRRPLVVGVLVVLAVAFGAGLAWFQPWKLWVDETVREDVPAAAGALEQDGADGGSAGGSGGGGGGSDGARRRDGEGDGRSPSPSAPAAEPTVLATGNLISQEHATSGKVRILQLADGTRVLRLEDLDTSNGPDLRVWITDAPVRKGREGWHVFDDGTYESLGRLKGNRGSQNYSLPSGLDLDRYRSVSLWCDRFDVSFGAAELARS